jgi:glutaconyl-CoA/methylmalonyl-CoA decarboxylase subunit delta
MTLLADITFSFRNIHGEHLVMVLVGYSVVFLSLAFLYAIFYNLPHLLHLGRLLKRRRPSPESVKEATATHAGENNGDNTVTGEVAAAISMALYLYVNEMHDAENRVLTIRKTSKRYSPWNSKIYNVTSGLNKRF